MGPNTNRAKYTDIQSALNALIESRHGGIFILDGVYTLPTTYLPDRDISVMGESMGGVELRNTANEQLFVLFDLTSNFNFSNFFVNSQNDGNTSDPLFRINGTTAASNTSRVFIEKVKFALKDTSTWAQTTGDCGIYCNRGQGSIVINNSYCEGGSYFVSINEYEIFRMSQCQTEDIMYADVNAVDLNDVEVAGLVSKNFRFRCLRFYNSDIKKRCIIQAVNAVSKSNLIGSKYQQGALVRYYDLVNIISSIFEIANGCSGAGQTAGIDTYNCNQLLVDKNIISINITDTYQTRGIGLFNINNGNVEGNNLRIDNTNIGQNHYGIFGQNLDDSVVNGNNVNMVNSGAKDVGYSWDATSTGNRGAGNLALNFGTAEIDLGGNSIDVNGA
uniref:Pectate lyase n=2 Tax=viral metagenome TaxID=1070528 RepID=A0A6M3J8U4_9ZZZZ